MTDSNVEVRKDASLIEYTSISLSYSAKVIQINHTHLGSTEMEVDTRLAIRNQSICSY